LIVADIAVPEGLWDAGKFPEGIVANWFYRDGSDVKAGAAVAELMVEKTTYEMTASVAGRLHILIPKDGVVRPGAVIGRIEQA
jgi:pyruvate/2-oxoglutarate dehydrogenase complex dihydrolipoamide acyltransferase (E2) component